jgi:uncharacterized membrane protein
VARALGIITIIITTIIIEFGVLSIYSLLLFFKKKNKKKKKTVEDEALEEVGALSECCNNRNLCVCVCATAMAAASLH